MTITLDVVPLTLLRSLATKFAMHTREKKPVLFFYAMKTGVVFIAVETDNVAYCGAGGEVYASTKIVAIERNARFLAASNSLE